jgi:hypothetical protein
MQIFSEELHERSRGSLALVFDIMPVELHADGFRIYSIEPLVEDLNILQDSPPLIDSEPGLDGIMGLSPTLIDWILVLSFNMAELLSVSVGKHEFIGLTNGVEVLDPKENIRVEMGSGLVEGSHVVVNEGSFVIGPLSGQDDAGHRGFEGRVDHLVMDFNFEEIRVRCVDIFLNFMVFLIKFQGVFKACRVVSLVHIDNRRRVDISMEVEVQDEDPVISIVVML